MTNVIPTTLETERELLQGVFYAFMANPTPHNLALVEDATKRYHKHMAERDEQRRDGHPTYRQMVGRAKRIREDVMPNDVLPDGTIVYGDQTEGLDGQKVIRTTEDIDNFDRGNNENPSK